jgi:tRNA A-37 threonylcarbamoyl transferase component Bud32
MLGDVSAQLECVHEAGYVHRSITRDNIVWVEVRRMSDN